MIRHYLPSIAAVIALVLAVLFSPFADKFADQGPLSLSASSVSAQTPPVEAVFEMRFFDPTEKNIKLTANPFEFTRPANVRKVQSVYCCFEGRIKLFLKGILVNEQTKVLHSCNRCGNDSEFVDWVIPAGTIADKIEQPGSIGEGNVTFIDILGNKTDTVSVNNMAKVIDRLSNVATTIGVQKIAVSTTNPEVIVWLGRPDDFLKKETTVFTDNVNACLDKDVDGRCDFLSIACNDKIDNDSDGKTDFPNDPGCESLTDASETDPPRAPACSDGLDNDGDRKIDFPGDPGCTSATGTDETDAPPPPPPPIDRTIVLKRGTQPTLVVQPLLKALEVIKFTTTCANCTIKAVPDPATFKSGTPQADGGFIILATLVNNADQSLTHTILVVGDAEENAKLSTADGQEYISQGNENDTQYPASFLSGGQNEYYIKARVDNLFEQVEVTPTPLPTVNGAAIKNGSVVFLFFQGNDSIGKKHVLITKGRFWDANTLADPALTPEPFHTFFQSKGSLAQCIQGLQAYPDIGTLFENPTGFQLFLDLLTLCQR